MKNSNTKRTGDAIRVFDYACDARCAIYLSNKLAGYIMSRVSFLMDDNNECLVSKSEIKKWARGKSDRTITRALNLLRFMNMVEIKHQNRIGMTLFRVNGLAFTADTDEALTNERIFRGELNLGVIDDFCRIDKKAIANFKINQKRQSSTSSGAA